MCGICFTLKQRIHRRPPRTAKEAPSDVVPCAMLQQYTRLLYPEAQGPAADDLLTKGHWMCPCLCGSCRCDAEGLAAVGSTTAAATPNGLRIIRIFHNRYNRHPLDITTNTCSFASICANSPSYATMLHNICRRGPDTFGATRRNFGETLLEVPRAATHAGGGAPHTAQSSSCPLSPTTPPPPAVTTTPTTSRGVGGAESTAVAAKAPVVVQKGQKPVGATTTTATAAAVMASTESGETEWCSFTTDTQAISAVLGLRGHQTVRQPYEIEVETDAEDNCEPNKSYLLWNGEIFNGPMCPPPWGSDTVALASRLSQLERSCVPEWRSAANEAERRLALPVCQQRFLGKCVRFFESEVQGPYGFLFYASQLQMIVFGRDPLGRHSLLTHLSVHPVVTPPSAQQQQQQQQHQRHRDAAAGEGDSVTNTGTRASPATEWTQLEVELLISSVGSQHVPTMKPLAAVDTGCVDNEEQEEARAGTKGEATCSASRSTGKRRRDGEDGDNHNGASDAAFAVGASGELRDAASPDGSTPQHATPQCWQELPITGFFALPMNIPVLACAPESTQAGDAATANAHQEGQCRTQTGGFFGCLPQELRGVLLHCPFEGKLHTTHPLLRAVSHGESGDATSSLTAPEEVSPGHLGEERPPAMHAPLIPEASMQMIPALVMEAIQRASPRDDSAEEAWVHWAACRYLEALSAAVYRRCNTAAAGAEDARGVEKLYRARRRPLCIPFSGGIDCTTLAALAHYAVPVETPIELVSVAFGEHPEQAPDRIAALHAMGELLALPQPPPELSVYAPTGPPEALPSEREWRLVFVDVPHRTTADTAHILDLMNPRHTVMDLDIATALWYAARARGRMQRLYARDVGASGANADVRDCVRPDADELPSDPLRSLENFSKHIRIHTPHAPSSAPLPAPVAATTTEVDAAAPFRALVEVLVAEGRSSPEGGKAPVLLSTLGKEYSPYLQPVVQQYGYKKLGSYLNDAVKAGVVVFVADAPSKAVRLKRPEDLRRAVPPPPCPWFMTSAMRLAQSARVADRGHVDSTGEDTGQGVARAQISAPPLAPPDGSFEEDYCSCAKVLLLGMGADETLGGYTRYRRFFQRHGMDGARRELQLDFSRLWQRNLGRDDRVTMDSGREPRFPYLDEELLATIENIVAARRESLLLDEAPGTHDAESAKARADHLLQMAIDPVLSFRLPPGEGDKRVLRRAATFLGLSNVTRLQKRAIQFGTRIAERTMRGSMDL